MEAVISNLELWGWRDFFAKQFPQSSETLARVIKEERDHYLLINSLGITVGGVISGNWRKRRIDTENPSVGDWVVLKEKTNEKNGLTFYLINERLKRFSQIIRKSAGPSDKSQLLAANIDVAFLVSSCNQDLEVRRIERYLSLLGDGEIKPILILNKCDLPQFEHCRNKISERFPEIPLLLTRSDQPESIDALNSYLGKGITSVFLGSSGVGKSTLTNHLAKNAKQIIQEIRDNDAKGRHTTTGRSMYLLSNQLGLVIDTPGLREVQLPIQENNFEEAFASIVELSLQCRFPNCRHQTEPNCAVKNAVKEGLILQDRLEHFHKLKSEIDKKVYPRKK